MQINKNVEKNSRIHPYYSMCIYSQVHNKIWGGVAKQYIFGKVIV